MTTKSSIEEKEKAFGLASKWTDLTRATVDKVESTLHDEILPRDWTYFDFKILRKLLKDSSLETASQIAKAMNEARLDTESPRYNHWWRCGGFAHEDPYTANEVIRAVKYLDWRLPGLRVKHSRAWTESEIEGIWRAFNQHHSLAAFASKLNKGSQFTVGQEGWVNFDRLSIEKIIDDKLQVVAQGRLWEQLQIRGEVLSFFGIEWRGRKFGKDVPFSDDNGGNSGSI